jgi:hypothetical protein
MSDRLPRFLIDGTSLLGVTSPEEGIDEALILVKSGQCRFLVCELGAAFVQVSLTDDQAFYVEWSSTGEIDELKALSPDLNYDELSDLLSKFATTGQPPKPRGHHWTNSLPANSVNGKEVLAGDLLQAGFWIFVVSSVVGVAAYFQMHGHPIYARNLLVASATVGLWLMLANILRQGEIVGEFYRVTREQQPVAFWLSISMVALAATALSCLTLWLIL